MRPAIEGCCVDADLALVQRFRDGDQAAFDEIVERHRRPVYLMALRLLGTHADADEAAQEAFLRAFRSLASLKDPTRFGPWLLQIGI